MGFLKGNTALKLFQDQRELTKQYWGRHLWARGYCVSTVGLNEEQLRKYVKWQQEREPKGQLLSLMPSRLVFMPPPLAVVSDYIKIILRIIL